MLSHVPPDLASGAALVVALHGCTQGAAAYAEGAGWTALADRHGFAVLAPEQRTANNANRCFTWFEPGDVTRGQGEAASIRAMIEQMILTHRLDRRRVFVTGLSAGGAMACALLATYPELFAGGAVIAGLPFGAAHNVQEAFGAMFQGRARPAAEWGGEVRGASPHPGPWPTVSVWHGDADATVQPSNGLEVARQWVEVHGLVPGTGVSQTVGRETRTVWAGNDGLPKVTLHRIAGLGHGTPLAAEGPDGCGTAGPYLLECGISSSLELAREWGLAVRQARAPQPTPTHPRPAQAASDRPILQAKVQPAPARAGFDVEATIREALTAAGLLKR